MTVPHARPPGGRRQGRGGSAATRDRRDATRLDPWAAHMSETNRVIAAAALASRDDTDECQIHSCCVLGALLTVSLLAGAMNSCWALDTDGTYDWHTRCPLLSAISSSPMATCCGPAFDLDFRVNAAQASVASTALTCLTGAAFAAAVALCTCPCAWQARARASSLHVRLVSVAIAFVMGVAGLVAGLVFALSVVSSAFGAWTVPADGANCAIASVFISALGLAFAIVFENKRRPPCRRVAMNFMGSAEFEASVELDMVAANVQGGLSAGLSSAQLHELISVSSATPLGERIHNMVEQLAPEREQLAARAAREAAREAAGAENQLSTQLERNRAFFLPSRAQPPAVQSPAHLARSPRTPRPAAENAEVLRLFSCAICMGVLHEPVTATCGAHNFRM